MLAFILCANKSMCELQCKSHEETPSNELQRQTRQVKCQYGISYGFIFVCFNTCTPNSNSFYPAFKYLTSKINSKIIHNVGNIC